MNNNLDEDQLIKESMLTTIDNPFDPFTQFDEWNIFDINKGYNSLSLLDRIAKTSSEMIDDDYDTEVERAIAFIISTDILDIRRRVVREVKPKFVEATEFNTYNLD